jgi:hypothetical protein
MMDSYPAGHKLISHGHGAKKPIGADQQAVTLSAEIGE